MDHITDYVSIRDNGKIRPENAKWSDSPELTWAQYWAYWGKEVANRWVYRKVVHQVNFGELGYEWVDLLPDKTGFLAFPNIYRSLEAKILNGDLERRCVLKPVFNVRGFGQERLEEVKKANFQLYGQWDSEPHFKQQVRNNRNRKDGILEVEGNDGIADCMYFFDMQTGAFVGAEPYTWCD